MARKLIERWLGMDKLRAELAQLNARYANLTREADSWRRRAMTAEQTVARLDPDGKVAKAESASIEAAVLTRLRQSVFRTYMCGMCGRPTVHQDGWCIGCGCKGVECE
jgi:hypothetical protein